jgi:hypothetical protein
MCPVSGDQHVSKIENLVLTNTSISERSVERLLKLLRLKSLDVRGSKISDVVIESLLPLRPTCSVLFDK